jgi:hypothetical protein
VKDGIERFFQKRDFKTRTENVGNAAHLVAFRRFAKEGAKRVEVVVSSDSNCLAVKFSTDETSFFMRVNSIISYAGAGFLVKRELESSEFYHRLEDEFWKELEEIVAQSSE